MSSFASLGRIFIVSVCAWMFLHEVWLLFTEIVFREYPITLLSASSICVILFVLRISPPRPEAVNEVFGVDPWLVEKQQIPSDKVVPVVAHRAGALDAPENSLTAIRMAKEKGCSSVEIDVSITADNVAILFHDTDVDRLTTSTGKIRKKTWNELKLLDISVKHPLSNKFKGEKIPLFEEAIEECLNLGLRMILDLKSVDFKVVKPVLNAFEKYEALYTKAAVTSFNAFVIYAIRRSNPRIVCSMSWCTDYFSQQYPPTEDGHKINKAFAKYVLACIGDFLCQWIFENVLYYVLGLSAVLLHKGGVNEETVQRWRNREVRIIPWTVNHATEKKYFSDALKVSYITDTLEGSVKLSGACHCEILGCPSSRSSTTLCNLCGRPN